MSTRLYFIAPFAAAVLLAAVNLNAQSITGSVSGLVRDSSSLAVAGASATLVSLATGAERGAISDTQGDFVFAAVAPGTYLLKLQVPGFKTLERSPITLAASEHLALGNLILEVGSAEQKITVTAQGATVQSESSERSSQLTRSQIDNLVVKGRNITSMVKLLPGVVDTGEGSSTLASGMNNSEDQIAKFYYFNVQGNRPNSNNVTLDGVVLSDMSTANEVNVAVGMDALSEVKALLGNYQAEYGRMSGAEIQLIAKSGARDFHGQGSYFKRHEEFNANNFFNNRLGIPKPWYRFNVWNYSISGPLFIPGHLNKDRNKLFFSWSQEFWPLKLTNPIRQVTVPTALERAGDFSQSLDQNNALIVVKDPTTGQPFPDNRIPANRIDPNGQVLLKVMPLPNFLNRSISAGAYNFVSQTVSETPNRVDTWKTDYNLNASNILSFTWSAHYRREEGFGTQSPVSWPWYSTRINSRSLFYAWHYQHIFSPRTVNELTIGANQHHGAYTVDPTQIARKTYGYTAPQLNSTYNLAAAIPRASYGGVPNAATIAFNYPPTNNDREVFNFADNLTKIVGSHTFKIGVFIEHLWIDDGPQTSVPAGSFDFSRDVNNPLDTGYAFSNGVLGNFTKYQEGKPIVTPEYRNHSVDWFVQDNWKVSRRLTLDFGVRFYWIQPYYEASGNRSSFVPANFNFSDQVQLIQPILIGGKRVGISPVDGTIFAGPAIGAIAPGKGDPANGMVIASKDKNYPSAMADTPPIRPAVRFGFAYDPFGNGKTAIRGGFGMFYDTVSTYAYGGLSTQYPILTTLTMNYDTIANLTNAPGLIYPSDVVGLNRTLQLPLTMDTSLSVQRELGFGTVLDIGYVGTLGRHLMWRRSISNIPLGADFDPKNADPTNTKVPLPSAFLRPFIGYNSINMIETAASSHYNSLQVSVNRRFTNNVQFGANWTWSKAMGFNDDENVVIDALMPVRSDYGLASFDRTHAFKFNWVYDLPSPFRMAPAKIALNGWQLSGILSLVSGAPAAVTFTTTNGVDITGTASQSPRPDVVGNPVIPKGDRTFYKNFDPTVFRLPAVGTFGNEGKFVMRGPGINNWDISLVKNFPIRERIKAQFRCEAYNALNHSQFAAMDTGARFDATGKQVNANLGAFTIARPPRVMQFLLRATF
jgi:hypothetical protein